MSEHSLFVDKEESDESGIHTYCTAIGDEGVVRFRVSGISGKELLKQKSVKLNYNKNLLLINERSYTIEQVEGEGSLI